MQPKPEVLLELAFYKMPFGKYKDWYLSDIPEYYYVWFRQKGFPPGRLGFLMQQVYEIKQNGLETLLQDLRRQHSDSPTFDSRSKGRK